jgi:hypothetical protein
VDDRARRIGLNEAVFRDVNERIDELAQTFRLQDQPLELVCECGNASCTQQIRVSRSEYEALRSDHALFAIYPGHEAPDVEGVVDKREGYDVVRKRRGEPTRLAEQTDPRG